MANIERLQKLADHLLHGKLGHKVFSFDTFNSGRKPICGTAGCAIGECPIVWPGEWKFAKDGDPVTTFNNSLSSSKDFFGIIHDEFMHLFVPDSQNIDKYGGKHLDDRATKEQVANNILEFIKIVK